MSGPVDRSESTRFVDLHAHILPGIDDGPHNLDESLALCRLLVDQGVDIVAATCHQRGQFAANQSEAIRDATNALTKALASADVPLRILPSAEWMLDADTVERLSDHLPNLMTIADSGRFALVEFPYQIPAYTPMVATMLRDKGIQPVLAHVEHYPRLAGNTPAVAKLIDQGYLIQMNADSIAGARSEAVTADCRALLRRGFVHLVASDAHSTLRRPPTLRQAFALVTGWTNPENARLLFHDNPLAIAEGREVVPPMAMNWLTRLRRW